MKLSRVLLDGDLFDNTIGKSQVSRYRGGTWLIRHNEYRILVEGRGSKTSDNRMYDVTIYNTSLHTCKHCIIWKHFVDRFKQRCSKTDVWYKICLLLIRDEDNKFSTVTNRRYIKGDDKYSFALAYDMTEDGILIYKTFFIKDNEHCV